MGLVRIQNVYRQFGGQSVLEDVSLELHTGQTAGLIGANGSGKTTLFKLIAGMLTPDRGTITCSKGLDIGYLAQEPQVSLDNTLHDEVAGAFTHLLALEQRLHSLSEAMADRHGGPELDELMRQYDQVNSRFHAAGGYSFAQRLHEVLGGLGFSRAEYDQPMSTLSGGQKCRAALAKLLLSDRRFLLLDEPTNHLDLDAIRWLERFLAGHHGGAVIVSHDRYLLDRLADRIIEIEQRRVGSYPGNYSNYVQTKQVRRLTEQRQYEKDQAFIEKERTFVAKHKAGQRSKEARGRQTRLERRLEGGEFVLDKPRAQKRINVGFGGSSREDGTVLRVDGLAKHFAPKLLFENLGFQVQAGQRWGITGPNGTGKTTLLRIILGQVAADAGAVQMGPRTTTGYYAQEASDLDPDRTVVECVQAVRTEWSEAQARTFLARLLFTGDDPFKRVGQLSGGEQSRIRLAKLILDAPNLLLLDEPTNHLDIPSREVLEEALADFPGAILAVSHDRYFLDSLVDHLLVIRPEGHRTFDGNYSHYVEQLERERGNEAERAASRGFQSARTEVRGSPAKGRQRRGGQTGISSPFDGLSVDELEAYIIEREERLAELSARFADPALYRDGQAIARLRSEIDALREELDSAERAWADRAESQ